MPAGICELLVPLSVLTPLFPSLCGYGRRVQYIDYLYVGM